MKTLAIADLALKRGRGVMNAVRRLPWMYDGLTLSKSINAGRAALSYAMKSETSSQYPPILKIDISPLCNLKCPICVHAEPGDNAQLQRQEFSPSQRMSTAQFARIIDEVSGHTSAASLYYLGDPLVHPELDAMCRIAERGKVNVHLSSNFSFALSDARIESLLTSGATHLTICVDGLSQETYGRTRVGGRIERVLSNLERLTRLKAKLRLRLPRIEVQYIRFRHNDHEFERAQSLFRELGVEQVSVQWGDVHNYTDIDVGAFEVGGPRPASTFPLCAWPFMSMVIRYDGEVIPCCEHRLGQQYAKGGDARPLGNVFRDGVASVWNSEPYRVARRMAVNAGPSQSNGEAKNHFCEGCSVVYETNRGAIWRSGRDYDAPLVPLRRKDRAPPASMAPGSTT